MAKIDISGIRAIPETERSQFDNFILASAAGDGEVNQLSSEEFQSALTFYGQQLNFTDDARQKLEQETFSYIEINNSQIIPAQRPAFNYLRALFGKRNVAESSLHEINDISKKGKLSQECRKEIRELAQAAQTISSEELETLILQDQPSQLTIDLLEAAYQYPSTNADVLKGLAALGLKFPYDNGFHHPNYEGQTDVNMALFLADAVLQKNPHILLNPPSINLGLHNPEILKAFVDLKGSPEKLLVWMNENSSIVLPEHIQAYIKLGGKVENLKHIIDGLSYRNYLGEDKVRCAAVKTYAELTKDEDYLLKLSKSDEKNSPYSNYVIAAAKTAYLNLTVQSADQLEKYLQDEAFSSSAIEVAAQHGYAELFPRLFQDDDTASYALYVYKDCAGAKADAVLPTIQNHSHHGFYNALETYVALHGNPDQLTPFLKDKNGKFDSYVFDAYVKLQGKPDVLKEFFTNEDQVRVKEGHFSIAYLALTAFLELGGDANVVLQVAQRNEKAASNAAHAYLNHTAQNVEELVPFFSDTKNSKALRLAALNKYTYRQGDAKAVSILLNSSDEDIRKEARDYYAKNGKDAKVLAEIIAADETSWSTAREAGEALLTRTADE